MFIWKTIIDPTIYTFAQQKLLSVYNKPTNKDAETLRNDYEKKLSDKNLIINELLKKVKALTNELEYYKSSKTNT